MRPAFRYVHHIFEAENPDILKGGSGTIREAHIEPRSCIETLKLGKGERINCIHRPTRKHLGNVCGSTEIVVVERNKDTVFRSLKVKLQIVDTHLTRQKVSRTGFLRGKIGSAAVRDDCGTRHSKPFRQVFSSGPAIDDNADPEKYQTESSRQDSGRKDAFKREVHIR